MELKNSLYKEIKYNGTKIYLLNIEENEVLLEIDTEFKTFEQSQNSLNKSDIKQPLNNIKVASIFLITLVFFITFIFAINSILNKPTKKLKTQFSKTNKKNLDKMNIQLEKEYKKALETQLENKYKNLFKAELTKERENIKAQLEAQFAEDNKERFELYLSQERKLLKERYARRNDVVLRTKLAKERQKLRTQFVKDYEKEIEILRTEIESKYKRKYHRKLIHLKREYREQLKLLDLYINPK